MKDIINRYATDLRIRTLWREIIMQAMRDACGVYDGSRAESAEYVKNQAQGWLLSKSRDFRDVCEYAQISPDVVFSVAEKLAKGGWVVPKRYFNLKFHGVSEKQLKKIGNKGSSGVTADGFDCRGRLTSR